MTHLIEKGMGYTCIKLIGRRGLVQIHGSSVDGKNTKDIGIEVFSSSLLLICTCELEMVENQY